MHPGRAEICDGFDNDCNGQLDDPTEGCHGELTDLRQVGGDVPVVDHDGRSIRPSMAWNRKGHLMIYEDDRQEPTTFAMTLYATHFDTQGNVESSGPLFSDPVANQSYPRIAWSGRQYGLVWVDARHTDGTVYFAKLDRNGIVTREFPLTDPINLASEPRIAWSGKYFGVAWTQKDPETDVRETYFTTLDESGSVGLIHQIEIASDREPRNLALSWNGSHFGLAVAMPFLMSFPASFHFVLIDEAGNQQGPGNMLEDGVIHSGYEVPVDLTWNGSQWGVWWEGDCGFFGCEVYLTRLHADGGFVDPANKHVNVTQRSLDSAELNNSAWNGVEYGMIFRDSVMSPEFFFSRVSAEGVMLGPTVEISNNGNTGSGNEKLVWNGRAWSVVWLDNHPEPSDPNLFFTRFANDQDDDGRVAGRDCDDADGTVWGPGPARDLAVADDKATLSWLPPADSGNSNGWPVYYDTVRSNVPDDFSTGNPQVVCLETEGADTTTVDFEEPAAGEAYHYLVRTFLLLPPEETRCGDEMGTESDGAPRQGRPCP